MEILFILIVMGAIVYGFGAVFSFMFGINKAGKAASTVGGRQLFSPLRSFAAFLGIDAWKVKQGAQFLSPTDLKKVLNPRNRGLLIDGQKLRLDESMSFKHTMIVAPTGQGKTTRYVLPNLLALDNCSIVVTDPSGELYRATAGAMQAKGYEVMVLSPADSKYSMFYNPLAGIRDYSDIMEISQTLVRSSNPDAGESEAFWLNGAADILSVLIRCLMAAGREYCNLGNLLYLLQNWGSDGRGLTKFIDTYADEAAFNQFKGIVAGNEKTTQGFLSTALTSLASLNNPDLAAMLSKNEVDLSKLRSRKTVLYLILPSQKIKHYSFIMNLFYVDLFNTLMLESPQGVRNSGRTCLPVHCLMDEFGHSSLPDFEVTCTVIRKYEVSLSIILQNLGQLRTNYGANEAQTIIDGGMQSKIFYPGLPPDTAKEVEAILGKEVVREIKWDGNVERVEQNLLNADRVRTMDEDKAIFVTSNKEPVILDTLPMYKNSVMKQMMRRKYRGKIKKRTIPKITYVPLK